MNCVNLQQKYYINKHARGSWFVRGLARIDSQDPSHASASRLQAMLHTL